MRIVKLVFSGCIRCFGGQDVYSLVVLPSLWQGNKVPALGPGQAAVITEHSKVGPTLCLLLQAMLVLFVTL